MLEYLNRNKAYVKSIQAEVGVTPDGVAGPQTLRAVEEHFDAPVISHNGKFIPLEFDGVINHSYSLHELPDGSKNWYQRKQPIDNICVHWGGLNALHCYQVFFNPKYAHASSHFLIGRNPKSEELEVLQCLDTMQTAWHAGKANKQSVGIDICQHPAVKYFDKTKEYYPGVEVVKNRSQRGPSDVVDIDPELAEFANDFIWALREVLELSHKPVCKDDEVYKINDAKQFSVLGHHNFSKQKWDPAPWADRLYHDLDEEVC
jgi:hypothetical protein